LIGPICIFSPRMISSSRQKFLIKFGSMKPFYWKSMEAVCPSPSRTCEASIISNIPKGSFQSDPNELGKI
jgi:hypothetical protein